MEREPFFVKSLISGNIVVLDHTNRYYYDKMINEHKSKDLIYLDENEQIIGTLELNPKEAEVYVEQVLEDLERREAELIKREAKILEKEFELAEREKNLNIAENTKRNKKEVEKLKEN